MGISVGSSVGIRVGLIVTIGETVDVDRGVNVWVNDVELIICCPSTQLMTSKVIIHKPKPIVIILVFTYFTFGITLSGHNESWRMGYDHLEYQRDACTYGRLVLRLKSQKMGLKGVMRENSHSRCR